MRLVATYLIGVAIGLVLLGLWQQARRQGQAPQPSGQVENESPARIPVEAPPPGPVGAP